ncbi:MAG: OsmC family protein [Fimbriimonadaceae bacterium]|nr:OsmC family protein [Fimbriimonadaceae bacterium]
MAKMHEYPVTVNWKGGRTGEGDLKTTRTNVQSDLRVPPEFGGNSEHGTNPEELLTSAIAACYSITFGIIADNRKLPFTGIETHATGEVEENGPQFKYTKITVRPTIHLSADADDSHVKIAEDMAHKADAYCIVTNAVRGNVEITVEPTILRA